ncbi:tRNA(Ile)-lysidine synthetase [Catenulispora acidiphila DSM 44928]|uniref:tRNA(Ile)-lysidine synthase n=1 Tax=Catenulispora acidiphila (strain DSM 44928 / JCM 14897 / NBRC 102108 / NRRL B-24433 / ID139908) TaxID=479433 RepID=C7PWZ4_CATAD|nr:tRNA lysidine(34) synthetase TilS [Catenulispora acidiphila]ACU77251.1 tRNA(Ile)-lysidine synthetase [Catenulispora acidiphila DSM 44928]
MGPAPAVAAIRLAVRKTLSGLAPGGLVLVACSGGADSIALACATAFVAPRLSLRFGGLTVDHNLQEGSAAQAERVVRFLASLGFDPVESLSVRVEGHGGPEAAARVARYGALDAAAERLGAATVLLGHTRDDQAETVLLGLARGSGARSLAGMPAQAGRYARPFLDLPRATTVAASAAEGFEPWDDPHNADPAYTRSRVRHAAIPALSAALGPGIPEALARTAKMLREDTEALDAWAAREFDRLLEPFGDCDLSHYLDVSELSVLPTAVRRRVLRLAALRAGCPGSDLAAVHIEELDRLLTDWRGQGPLHLPSAVAAARRYGKLAFERSGALRRGGADRSDPGQPAEDPAPAGLLMPA